MPTHHTVYEYDWVRVVAPQADAHAAKLTPGGHTPLVYRRAPEKPPREDTEGNPFLPEAGEITVDIDGGLGLYVRTINHRSSGVWVDAAQSTVTPATLANMSGWATYNDTQYTEQNPLELGGNRQWQMLPNNAGFRIDDQLPADVTSFYENGKIIGRSGDGIGIAIRFKMQASTNGLVGFHTGVDIGGSQGIIFEDDHTPAKGRNTEQPITSSFQGYQLDTWEANGGVVMIKPRNAIRVYDISYFIQRIHKAR